MRPFFETYSQMSVQELQERAKRSARQAEKKGQKYEPVVSRTKSGPVCTTWWGKAWCDNLERYSDYENRLPRGRRYIRNGALLDLKIHEGEVKAKVQGSAGSPYSIDIKIDPLDERRVEKIMSSCSQKIGSLEALANGKFPEELREAFLKPGGLFPSPKEIHIHCDCPDWAYLCKHAACAMYGIGVKLDENPFFFFELRGIDTSGMIRKSVENKVEALLENAGKPSGRIISDDRIESLFALDCEE